jgi:hypothetical protein
MTTKRLYNVMVEYKLVILADSEGDAEYEALEVVMYGDLDDPSCSAVPLRYFPSGWNKECLPYGDMDQTDPDRTIQAWMDLGAAPELNNKPRAVRDEVPRISATVPSDPKETLAISLLRRLRQWDHLSGSADGPFWANEIDAVLADKE